MKMCLSLFDSSLFSSLDSVFFNLCEIYIKLPCSVFFLQWPIKITLFAYNKIVIKFGLHRKIKILNSHCMQNKQARLFLVLEQDKRNKINSLSHLPPVFFFSFFLSLYDVLLCNNNVVMIYTQSHMIILKSNVNLQHFYNLNT